MNEPSPSVITELDAVDGAAAAEKGPASRGDTATRGASGGSSWRDWRGRRRGDAGLIAGVVAACLCLAAPLAVVFRAPTPGPVQSGASDVSSWSPSTAAGPWEASPHAHHAVDMVFGVARSWSGSEAGPSPLDAWASRRVLGIACAVVAAASVGALAAIHSGSLAGVLALLVFASSPGWVRWIAYAPEAMVGPAAATLAVALGLAGLRPWRAKTGVVRPALAAIGGGAAMGLVALIDGWPGIAAVVLPLVLMTLTEPGRASRLILIPVMSGVAALVLLSRLPSGPGDEAWLRAATGGLSAESLARTADGLKLSAAWIGLWALWTPAALLQAWSTSTQPSQRRRMLAAVAWPTGLLALAFAAPGSSVVFASLISAWAVAIGVTLRQLHELCSEGRHPRLWRVTRWVCLAAVVAGTAAAPAVLYAPLRPEAWSGWGMPDRSAGVMAAAVLTLAALSLLVGLSTWRHHPARAAVILAGYASTAVCLAPLTAMTGLLELESPVVLETVRSAEAALSPPAVSEGGGS
ncbi:MAG: hypothetical protein AAGA57_07310 [Planctomycetota bacterium]